MIIGKRIGLQLGKATRDAFGEALRDLGRRRDRAPPHRGSDGAAWLGARARRSV